MMSQTNLPIYSYENDKKNPVIHYNFKINEYKKRLGNFYFSPGTPNPNLEPNPVPAFNTFLQTVKNVEFVCTSEGTRGCLCPPLPPSVEHIDQQRGARHYLLGYKDVKIMKNLTIILIGCMTLGLKLLAMFTLSMGSISINLSKLKKMNPPPHC